MDRSDRKRPLLASVICVGTVIVSGQTLMRGLHLIPPLTLIPPSPDHIAVHSVLKILEPVLNLLGAIYLWQMRPLATILFAAETIVIMLSGLYLGFISPGEHMLALRFARPEMIISLYLLAVAFDFALTIYVWRITAIPRGLRSEAIPSN
jgi:hypothetical protein